MSFSNEAETAVLQQIFVGTALPWNGNTDLYISLHTADPGEGASATSSEANYGSYARVAVTRATDFTISGATVANDTLIQFPTCDSGTSICTYVGIVNTSTGSGTMLVSGQLNSTVTVTTGIQPQFSAGTLTFTLD